MSSSTSSINPHQIPIEYNTKTRISIVLTNIYKMLVERGTIPRDQQILDTLLAKKSNNDVYELDNENVHINIRLSPQALRTFSKESQLHDFLESNKDKHNILVFSNISPKIHQEIIDTYPETELFTEANLLTNVTEHIMVPKHIPLTNAERDEILVKYSGRKRDIPKMLQTDRIARHFNLKPESLVQIIRPSSVTGDTPYYRFVIPARYTEDFKY